MKDSFIQAAFDEVCKDAKPAVGWYVTLMTETCRFVSPAEGGTYAHDNLIVAYQHFSTEEAAAAVKGQVEQLACELSQQAQRGHNEHCSRELDWLAERGLDSDFLPEPDGPSRFYVVVSAGLPQESRGPTHYE